MLDMAQGKPIGLGTMIAKFTSALGIKPCASCEQRKETLDRIVPNIWCRKCKERKTKTKQTQPRPGQGGP